MPAWVDAGNDGGILPGALASPDKQDYVAKLHRAAALDGETAAAAGALLAGKFSAPLRGGLDDRYIHAECSFDPLPGQPTVTRQGLCGGD